MRTRRFMWPVQRVGLYALLSLLIFALVFAFIPTGTTAAAKTGAELEDVDLTLYPTRDPDAIWRFKADHVTNDPLTSTTVLKGLSGGERLLREKDPMGRFTGKQTVDATLHTGMLTIDGQDNMVTPQAEIYLVRSCATVKLQGNETQPVRIEQGSGFSTPLAVVDSPSLRGKVTRLRMTFDFYVEDSGTDSETIFPLDPTHKCLNGKIVPITPS